MKTYKQVEDVLSNVEDFHRKDEFFYERCAERAEKERVKAFLEHLGRRERKLSEGLKRFLKQGMPYKV